MILFGDRLSCQDNATHADAVQAVQAQMPEPDVFYDLSMLFKAFSDKTRVQVLWALSKSQLCVCDLAFLLGKTESAISHQLKLLRLANLVKSERQGKHVFYALADEHVQAILAMGFEHVNE
ncbi:MAG: metalloregulator ArsR/SmtB family transcription factor [Coriobacteriia bacterium]|nr:metalloregulator ArsR/SmtB family transcription factor [Coriobacteriia bacterium]